MDYKQNIAAVVDTDLLNRIKDPQKAIKDIKSQYKALTSKSDKLSADLKSSADKTDKFAINAASDQKKKILGNVTKTLLPALAMALTAKIVKSINFNSSIEDMIDETNDVIDKAQTRNEINNSKVLRDRALATIDSNEKNIIGIRNDIKMLNQYVSIFNVVINIITILPTPVAVPPGIGVPMSLIMKFVAKLGQAKDIVAGLNVVLSIILPILDRIISELDDLKNQLHNINTLVDDKSLDTLTDEEFQEMVETIRKSTTNDFPIYKGYKFKLKEEENIEYNVKGNKRHYAVAINSAGIEVYQSEYSFTLDPDILIAQLKLKIDQQK